MHNSFAFSAKLAFIVLLFYSAFFRHTTYSRVANVFPWKLNVNFWQLAGLFSGGTKIAEKTYCHFYKKPSCRQGEPTVPFISEGQRPTFSPGKNDITQ